MKEKILNIISRVGKNPPEESRYYEVNIYNRDWNNEGMLAESGSKLANIFEPIIEKDFDAHNDHYIIKTTEQVIIIEASPNHFHEDTLDSFGKLHRATGSYLEDIAIYEGWDINDIMIMLIINIVTNSTTLRINIDATTMSRPNTARIESNQLTMKFYA